MIKLFRNIRKSLLNKGKATKYLRYAIGEIILAVIGILIALQLNARKEENTEKISETVRFVFNRRPGIGYSCPTKKGKNYWIWLTIFVKPYF
jgi:hypothetical protein